MTEQERIDAEWLEEKRLEAERFSGRATNYAPTFQQAALESRARCFTPNAQFDELLALFKRDRAKWNALPLDLRREVAQYGSAKEAHQKAYPEKAYPARQNFSQGKTAGSDPALGVFRYEKDLLKKA